jgi:vancomycin permeability regulator SanA
VAVCCILRRCNNVPTDMKRTTCLLTILIISTFAINALYAQTSVDDITKEFFKKYEKSPQKAVDFIFETNKWMERKQDGIETVKNQLMSTIALVGDYYGYEKITVKSLGDNYRLESYLLKYDRQPLRFTFIFYKPKDKWQVQNFKFDDEVSEELR